MSKRYCWKLDSFILLSKDMTPGCTTQACDFTANLYKFDNLKATVIGVSQMIVQNIENL